MEYFEITVWTVFGLVIGSFVNVCLDRLPLQFADEKKRLRLLESPELSCVIKQHLRNKSLSLVHPARSFCFACGHQLRWFENIPLFSYLLNKGRCRKCHAAYGFRTFWVEAAHGLSYALLGRLMQGWV